MSHNPNDNKSKSSSASDSKKKSKRSDKNMFSLENYLIELVSRR